MLVLLCILLDDEMGRIYIMGFARKKNKNEDVILSRGGGRPPHSPPYIGSIRNIHSGAMIHRRYATMISWERRNVTWPHVWGYGMAGRL
jgi:hypothetical protein